jgi:hypothetical protein
MTTMPLLGMHPKELKKALRYLHTHVYSTTLQKSIGGIRLGTYQ